MPLSSDHAQATRAHPAARNAGANSPSADTRTLLSKDEINALPIRSYEGEIWLVRTEEELAQAMTALWQEDVLGFDTETRPCFIKGKTSSPALLQLAAENLVVLIQLTRLPFNAAMAELLAAPHVVKAGVAIRDDIRALAKLHPFTPGGGVDLANLAQAKGIKAQGLRTLAANLLEFRISKSAQCSNWENDSLSLRQIRYAATDAWVGRELYKLLK